MCYIRCDTITNKNKTIYSCILYTHVVMFNIYINTVGDVL